MPTIKTKWFTSAMAGAPSIVGNIGGGLISVLTACLKDGFNLLTLDSLVVAGNVATGTKAGHGFIVNQVVLIAGATPAGLNGEWRVTSVTANTVQFATTGISDQTATGTITIKAAPCGWLVPFTGTNLAVFKSGDVLSSQLAIKVDDTVAQYSTIRAAEGFTDISTEVNGYSTQYMRRSNATDATGRPWLLIADAKSVYIGIQWTNAGVYDFYHFGDFSTFVVGDISNFRLQGLTGSGPGSIGQYASVSDSYVNPTFGSGVAPRPYSQIFGATTIYQGSAVAASGYWGNGAIQVYAHSGNHGYGANANYDQYVAPGLADNGYHFFPVYLFEAVAGGKTIRGKARGLLHILEYMPVSSGYNILSGVEGVSGALVLLARSAGTAANATSFPATCVAFSLGDWE